MTKKSMKKKLPAAVLSATILVSTAVMATHTANINGQDYTCENRVMYTADQYGGYTVRDSKGGRCWIGGAFM